MKTVASRPVNTEKDDCAMYGNLVANKLRALNENNRALAMLEIDRILYNFKFGSTTSSQQHNMYAQRLYSYGNQPQTPSYWLSQGSSSQTSERSECSSSPSSPWFQQGSPRCSDTFTQLGQEGQNLGQNSF